MLDAVMKRLAAAVGGIGHPVEYARRTAYRRPPALYRHLQWIGVVLTSLGIGPAYTVTLEVPGRRSGKPRRTVLVQTSWRGERYLVALSGESEWVRNVRAAGGRAVVSRGRRRIPVRLVEVPVGDRPPIIRAYLGRGGRLSSPALEARHYFGLRPDPPLDEIRTVVGRYPVFHLVPAPDSGGAQPAGTRDR